MKRNSSPLKWRHYAPDISLLCVRWYCRYQLSRTVSPGYFSAMGIPVLRGRYFTEQDAVGALPVAIINDTMARRYWPGQDPVGKRLALHSEALRFSSSDRPPQLDMAHGLREIVGVVGNVRHYGLDIAPKPEMYMPYLQRPSTAMSLVIKTDSAPESASGIIERALSPLDKDQPVSDVREISQLLSDSVARARSYSLILTLFALTALILAATGVYGVMSQEVNQRAFEIGIHMNNAGERRQLFRLVIGQGMLLTLSGVAIGITTALALTHLMSGLLYEVSTTDPVTFAGASLMLISVTLLACYIPARNATTQMARSIS